MKTKRLLFLVMAIYLASGVKAQKHEFSDGLFWELNNGVLTISGNGAIKDYSHPWDGKGNVEKVVIENGVTSIGDAVFWENNKPQHNLKSVVIGNSVTSIGGHAFSHCNNLTSVTLPNSVTSIGGHAFSHCNNLSSVTLPNSLKTIREYTFYGCKSLASIIIPNSVTSIGYVAFGHCENLLSVTIPNSVVNIGEQAFTGCSNLTSVTMPSSVTSIGECAFSGCSNLIISNTGSKAYNLMKKGGYKGAIEMKNGNSTYYKVNITEKGFYRYGLTNSEGKEIIPCELEKLEVAGSNFFRFKLNGYWGIVNSFGKIIIPTDRGYTKIGDYVSFTKRFPYEMDGYKGECNNLGVQVSKIKVTTPVASSGTTSSSTTSSSTTSSSTTSKSNSNTNSTSGSTTQTVVVEHHRDPVPVQEWQACFACGGMGTMGCDNCGGSGTKYIGDRLHRCSRCNGRGIIPCNICFGNKGQYITVYR